MDRVKKHFKNNFAIYTILLVCVSVIFVALFVTHEDNEEVQVAKVDTKYFEVVTLQEALKLFEQDTPSYLVVGLETCSATINYVPYLQIAEAKFGFKIYYLELSSIDETQLDDLKKFREKLNIEYELQDKVDTFGEFIQTTPATIIIKNKKQVFGYYGSMNTTTIETLARKYGLIMNENN